MPKPSGTNHPKAFRERSSRVSSAESAEGYFGGYGDGVHLFPFRTEKLSPSSPMILRLFVEK